MPYIIENHDPKAQRCSRRTGVFANTTRCPEIATLAEIRKYDWREIYLRCDQHADANLESWFQVPLDQASRTQQIMITRQILDQKLDYAMMGEDGPATPRDEQDAQALYRILEFLR